MADLKRVFHSLHYLVSVEMIKILIPAQSIWSN